MSPELNETLYLECLSFYHGVLLMRLEKVRVERDNEEQFLDLNNESHSGIFPTLN